MESPSSSRFGVLGDRQSLSHQVRAEIMALSGPRARPFLLTALYAWAVIIGVVWWALAAQGLWATLFAIVIVATRQNMLALLVHDQTHCLDFPARPGDLIATLLAGYPLLLLTGEGYAQAHLSHHKYFFTGKDPDFLRKSGPVWTFPMPGRSRGKRLLTDLFGLNVVRMVKGKKRQGDAFKRLHPTPTWVRRAICEHKYNRPDASVTDTSLIIVPRRWEKPLPNPNRTVPPYRHFFPGVSFSLPPRVHAILCHEGLTDDSHVFHGYAAYLKYLIRPPETATAVPVA